MAPKEQNNPGPPISDPLTRDPVASAQEARLVYINDELPGFRRRRCGRGFTYLDRQGNRLQDARHLRRIRKLVIPPAWQMVWISPEPRGHIQATGRDARGRKQYIYHPRWEEIRNRSKYDRLIPFARCLPRIRARVLSDLGHAVFSKRTVLAFAMRLLEETYLRIGNPEYARLYQSYGLTTLRDYHIEVVGDTVQLQFRGKRGKLQSSRVRDRKLARLARKYQELPGQELLKYRNGSGEWEVVESEDVNRYLKEISDHDFTAKDYRTWGGTVIAATELIALGKPGGEKDARRKISRAVRRTAARLGNTPAICRKYYVHPAVLEGFMNGGLFCSAPAPLCEAGDACIPLSEAEAAVLAFLESSGEELLICHTA